jgi:hypothetical protein
VAAGVRANGAPSDGSGYFFFFAFWQGCDLVFCVRRLSERARCLTILAIYGALLQIWTLKYLPALLHVQRLWSGEMLPTLPRRVSASVMHALLSLLKV